jgi:hypothetical protein
MRTGRMRVPRTRGALSGTLLILLGVWGAIIPFVGPYFDFAYTPDNAWTWTAARGWLDVLPGVVVALAGLVMLLSINRLVACTASWFAVAGGAWFVIGLPLAPFMGLNVGLPTASSTGMRALEALAYFYALGAVILFLASAALGRLSVHSVSDWRAAERRVADERAMAAPAAAPTATTAVPAAAPTTSTAVPAAAPTTSTAPADGREGEDVVARENARRAIAREQNDHAHRHFLRMRRGDRERDREQVSASGDRSPQ